MVADPNYLRKLMLDRGMPPHVAEGFLMNFRDESGFNPGINEISPMVPGSRGGFGLYQVTGPRRRAYESFASERGLPLDSPEAQIDFMMTELQGPESGAARSIFAAQDPNQAAVAIARDFLRPAPENLQRRVASYGGGGGSGSASSGSNSGGGTMPMGLFDMQEQPPQTFGERLRAGVRSGSLIDSLALAANSLRDRPDQNIAQIVQGRQERRDEKATANRTAAWLASQGREDLAQAMLAGGLDPKSAVAAHMAAMAPADPLAAIELEKAQIELQNLQNPVAEFRTLTADETTAMGLPPGAYQIGADGKISTIGGGGTTVNNMMGAVDKFEEEFAKLDAKSLADISATGIQANRNIGRIDQLGTLLANSPQGMEGAFKLAAGELGIDTEGLSGVQATQAVINSLVPEQRAPGSGPMSDADLALFKQSLPRIINQPGGNAIILDTMRAIAQYDAEGAVIAQQFRSGEIDRAKAFELLQSRENPLSNFKAPAPAAAPSGGGGGGAAQPAGGVRTFNPATGKLE